MLFPMAIDVGENPAIESSNDHSNEDKCTLSPKVFIVLDVFVFIVTGRCHLI